jgi:hypothetical protein
MRFVNDEATEAEIHEHIHGRNQQLQKIDDLLQRYYRRKKSYPKDKAALAQLIQSEFPHYLKLRNYNQTAEGYYLSVEDTLTFENIILPLDDVVLSGTSSDVDQDLVSKILSDPASNKKDKRKAIMALTDQDVLAKIAFEEKDADFRRVAVSRLTDQAALKKVMASEQFAFIRAEALKNITDQRYVERIAGDHREENMVRTVALERVAMEGLSDLARVNAIQEITDQKVLLKIAQDAENMRIKAAAIKKITHTPYLEQLKSGEKDAYVLNLINGQLLKSR